MTAVRPLAIIGPTGTGKSDLALEVAAALRDEIAVEVVNADALQLYRGMDVGTAKVPPAARRGVPHHVLDVLDPAALDRADLTLDEIDLIELNEAFAAQSLACTDAWGVDPEIVNAWGGAIAIGHPLGASGTRVLGTLARRLEASGERWGVAALCIGVGQGIAVVLENVAAR